MMMMKMNLISTPSLFIDGHRFPTIADVLILEQFVEGDGKLISRTVTGLCKRQQFRITKLVKMAQKAGLMPGKDLGRQTPHSQLCQNTLSLF